MTRKICNKLVYSSRSFSLFFLPVHILHAILRTTPLMESGPLYFFLNCSLCRMLTPSFSPYIFLFKLMTRHSRSSPPLQGWIKCPSSVFQSLEQGFSNCSMQQNHLECLLKHILLIQSLTEQVTGGAYRVDRVRESPTRI